MSKKVLVPIATGTEEGEAIIIIDLLRRAKLEVTIAGISEKITTSHEVNIIPDCLLINVNKQSLIDAIVLPGGLAGVEAFLKNEHLLEILKFNYNKTWIAAICAAPLVLKEVQILDGDINYTCHPSVIDRIGVNGHCNEKVVINQSHKIITAKALGQAIDFTLAITEELCDKNIASDIAHAICYV